ncbi:MAG: hypothetical protein KAI34_05020 [Candidatus Lokiarchaeota archaeon]|nr:hypothetical protein [Candidatus Lokiarchaeota archaeon]
MKIRSPSIKKGYIHKKKWEIKSPMTKLNIKEHTGKTMTEGGVTDSSISLIDNSQKKITTG